MLRLPGRPLEDSVRVPLERCFGRDFRHVRVHADERAARSARVVGAAAYMHGHHMSSAFLVSDPWHNARISRMASDLGIQGYASATWTSAATSEDTRFTGYARETLAYLYYRVFGR